MIDTLSANEVDVVSGGHFVVNNAEYVGRVNGYRDGASGHYDMFQTADGCLVAIWHAD